jgi:hypothetical protein
MGSISRAAMALGSVVVVTGAVLAFGIAPSSRAALAQPAAQLHCALPDYGTRRS